MISEKLIQLICMEFELEPDEIDINDATKADQLPGWDSLRNISLIARIENDYCVKLRMIEMLRCKNVGDIQILIYAKISVE